MYPEIVINEKQYFTRVILLNTLTSKRDTILTGVEGPRYLLKGERDGIISIINCKGSGGYCSILRLDIDQKKEIEYHDMNAANFMFEKYTKRGYKGTCFIRKYLDEKIYGTSYSVEIDYHGNTLWMKMIEIEYWNDSQEEPD